MVKKKLDPALYQKSELIIFEDGLFGFEEFCEYLPLPIDEGNNDILSLQSVDDEELSFIIMNPFTLLPTYSPKLSEEDYKKLGSDKEEELSYYTICVISEQIDNSTINLKCPIVVNATNRKAIQTILQTEDYSFRHSFNELKKGR